MNKNELKEILTNLTSSKDNVILIDGKWGSGKTYLLNEFIKEYKKHPIYYVSLLGKRNIDDINTSLYIEVHNNKDITTIIPSAVNPFINRTSLDYILKINSESSYIVILDDLERYGSSNYDEFLSYVSNLVLKGAKVVVVSNSEAIGAGEKYNFEMYKEKIFDHIYKADLFSSSVFEQKLNKFYKYFDEYLINSFDSNIRLVDKLSSFLIDLDKYLDKYKESDSKMKNLIFDSINLLKVIYNETKLSYPKLALRANVEETKIFMNAFKDESDKWETLKIYEFIINTPYEGIDNNINQIELIIALYDFYLFGKHDKIEKILGK